MEENTPLASAAEKTAAPETVSVIVHPTVSDTFGHGWDAMKKFFPEFLLVILILIVFSLPMGLTNAFAEKESFGYVFFSIFNVFYWLIIMSPLHYGSRLLGLKAIRNEPFRVNEIFMAYRNTLQIALANLLTGAIIALGTVMLIVPGIIFACKLSMVPYLVMDKNMEAVDAIRTSWKITRGFSWTIFGMGLLCIPIYLGGLILLIVGIVPASIWTMLAFAAMFAAIDRKTE